MWSNLYLIYQIFTVYYVVQKFFKWVDIHNTQLGLYYSKKENAAVILQDKTVNSFLRSKHKLIAVDDGIVGLYTLFWRLAVKWLKLTG